MSKKARRMSSALEGRSCMRGIPRVFLLKRTSRDSGDDNFFVYEIKAPISFGLVVIVDKNKQTRFGF